MILMVMDFAMIWNVIFSCDSLILQASSASAHGVGSASRGSINSISPTKPPIKTTTDDTPDFDRSKV